jgi:EAL domain-containing protein (putative c-di-GMP-specific phosphodiesterase class I)
MSYLKSFNLDALKIDRSFIKDLPDDGDYAAITQAIIALAHSLDLSVTAEGIETEEQLEFLHNNRCDEIQEHFVSKPLPEKQFSKWLSENQQTLIGKQIKQ